MLRRPVAAGALLLALYAGLSFTKDPRGYLGTDTGSKVATLRAMEQRGDLHPDVGYWAERWDPTGDLHPLGASRVGRRWVTVATLPMLYASYPLYRVAGLRALIVFPALGALAAAFAARRLAQLIGRADGDGGGDGWAAFWLIGLASPLVIYALDFWEHAPGVGLMGWGVALLVGDRPGWRRFALAGLAFGAAATLRTEALVYGAATAGVVGLGLLCARRREGSARLAHLAGVGALFMAGLAVPLVANAGLERAALGRDLRGTRTASLAGAAGSEAAIGPSRAEEALITTLSSNLEPPGDYLLGGVFVALVGYAAAIGRRRSVAPSVLAVGGAALAYVAAFRSGPGFIPGMLIATPLAVVGAARGRWSGPGRSVLVIAVLALPAVWWFQYIGFPRPQWAGRYVLLSGFLLGALGSATLRDLPKITSFGLAGLACAVSTFGLAWTQVRSEDVARVSSLLERRSESVLVFRAGYLPREAGAAYPQRWLAAGDEEEVRRAADVALSAGFSDLAVVELAAPRAAPREIPKFRRLAVDRFTFLDVPMDIVSYRARGRAAVRP